MEALHVTKRTWNRGLLASAVLGLTLASGTAWGAFMTFNGIGSGVDGALEARADFTTGAGTLSITLTNLLGADEIISSGQALSDISFDLVDGTTGTVGPNTASGQFGDVSTANTGVVTYVAADTQTGNTTPTRWLTSPLTSFGTTHILLESLGGGQPSQMIAPFIADGGTYTSVNSGFDNFNSYVIGPGTFSLLLSGVTADTTIANVQFSFGTNAQAPTIPGVPPVPGVPEPASLALIGLGLFGLAALRRKQR